LAEPAVGYSAKKSSIISTIMQWRQGAHGVLLFLTLIGPQRLGLIGPGGSAGGRGGCGGGGLGLGLEV